MKTVHASDSFVVGTAGHIDHGKSSLVKALTRIDPDRLDEEKRRGMTIDLGFAYMDLPSGRHVGLVDVPGHQRFLKNMLAGVHGMDAVLLVVAADEGPMPQTREHLAIIDLLGIQHGVVVLSKADLVDSEWLRLMRDEVSAMLRGSSLRNAAIVSLSSTTGEGLEGLCLALDEELGRTFSRPDLGRPRLPVDRAFGMPGFGTVVTGTLVGGALRQGDELTILPGDRRVRVRGLQQHNQPVEEALPGSRTAVNLAGVDRNQVRRGDVLVIPGTVQSSRRIDARLTVLDGAPHPLRHRARLLMYHETAEIPVEVNLLDSDELAAGERGWAQLYTMEPAVAIAGDRFIIRLPSPPTTLAGGVIVDTVPRRHRRHDRQVIEELVSREAGDPLTSVELELAKHPSGIEAAPLSRIVALSPETLAATLERLALEGRVRQMGPLLVTQAAHRRLQNAVSQELLGFHAAQPLRPGMPREALRSRLALNPAIFQALLATLRADGVLVETASEVALAGHRLELTEQQSAAAVATIQALDSQPFSPPLLGELAQRYGLTPALIQHLINQGEIVRVSDEVVFSREAVSLALARFRTYLGSSPGLSVAAARDLLGSSRRYVLPLLEWLDAQRITRRVGDDRILRT